MIWYGANNFNEGMIEAANMGNIRLIKYMVENGSDDWAGAIMVLKTKGDKKKITKVKRIRREKEREKWKTRQNEKKNPITNKTGKKENILKNFMYHI